MGVTFFRAAIFPWLTLGLNTVLESGRQSLQTSSSPHSSFKSRDLGSATSGKVALSSAFLLLWISPLPPCGRSFCGYICHGKQFPYDPATFIHSLVK